MKGNKEKDFQNHIINALKDGGYKYIKESEKKTGWCILTTVILRLTAPTLNCL